jgi:ketosteroid isomerase-like protein
MPERLEVVAKVYNAFAAADGAALGGLLGDTEWHEAAGMPYGGHYRGLGEIAANVFGPIAEDITNFSAVPDELIEAGDDQVLALGRYRGTGKAGPLDVHFAHLWTIDGDRISRFVQFVDTHEFRKALG